MEARIITLEDSCHYVVDGSDGIIQEVLMAKFALARVNPTSELDSLKADLKAKGCSLAPIPDWNDKANPIAGEAKYGIFKNGKLIKTISIPVCLDSDKILIEKLKDAISKLPDGQRSTFVYTDTGAPSFTLEEKASRNLYLAVRSMYALEDAGFKYKLTIDDASDSVTFKVKVPDGTGFKVHRFQLNIPATNEECARIGKEISSLLPVAVVGESDKAVLFPANSPTGIQVNQLRALGGEVSYGPKGFIVDYRGKRTLVPITPLDEMKGGETVGRILSTTLKKLLSF